MFPQQTLKEQTRTLYSIRISLGYCTTWIILKRQSHWGLQGLDGLWSCCHAVSRQIQFRSGVVFCYLLCDFFKRFGDHLSLSVVAVGQDPHQSHRI